MIEQYKEELGSLKDELDYLLNNQDDLDALYKYQIHLIKCIKEIETKIRELKRNTEDPKPAQILLSKFKSFGDSVAFGYLDTHDLKQLSFNLENEKHKNKSGFISGKKGFDFELEILQVIIYNHNIPAMLCDITNSLRYGDIITLVHKFMFIECKSGKSKSSRESRQKRIMDKLVKYYKEDKKISNNGDKITYRVEAESKPKRYVKLFNEAIDEALSKGANITKAEKGLYYLVIKDIDALPQEFSKYNLNDLLIFPLNEIKNNQQWISYEPYQLNIYKKENLLSFILGEVVINVFIDVKVVEEIASTFGLQLDINLECENPFFFYMPVNSDEPLGFSMSWHIINRIAYEMYSLEWVINNSVQIFKKNLALQN